MAKKATDPFTVKQAKLFGPPVDTFLTEQEFNGFVPEQAPLFDSRRTTVVTGEPKEDESRD